MPERARRPYAARGMSMVELVSTMSISAILLLLAVPSYNGMRGPYALRQATHQITAEFQKARMRAIARNARHRFTYDTSTKAYLLQREVATNSWTTESATQLPSGVTVSTLGSPPIFDTRGMLNAPLTITVNVQGHSVTRTLTINVLGNVTLS
jgi:prepilin-type N-terminal cleavage/methylation domain-containing protein